MDSNTSSGNPLFSGRFVVPSVVATHFQLRPGDKVADFGAGSGYFLETLSKLVGDEGSVYACEIQKQLVEKIGDLVRLKNLSNVDPLWSDVEEIEGTKIPTGILDAGILVNSLFQFEQKEIALQEIFRTLRNGGKLFVIDWANSFSGMGPQADQVVDKDEAMALCETAGLVLEREFDAGDHHYGLAFRKP